jgi:cytochrome c553
MGARDACSAGSRECSKFILGTSNRKSGTRIIDLLVPFLLPKFVSEDAAMYHELRKRGTRWKTSSWHRKNPSRSRAASAGRHALALSITAAGLLVFAPQSSVAENDQAAQLAATCASCHRLDGHDVGIPLITGLSEEKLRGVMQAFKSGERGGQIMHAIALSLSEEEMAIIAHYLAAQGKGD